MTMIPTLNMTKLHNTASPATGAANGVGSSSSAGPAGQGSAARVHTGRQMSPRTPNTISPRDATSSQPSAHLTRRAAEVTPVLEMNPLLCQNVSELQRKLIETAEWVIKLRYYYTTQLQERDQWLDTRMRDLERLYAEAVTTAVEKRLASMSSAAAGTAPANAGGVMMSNGAPATIPAAKSQTTPIRQRRTKSSGDFLPLSVQSSQASSPQPSLPRAAAGADAADSGSSATRSRPDAPKQSTVVPITHPRRTASANGPRRPPPRADDAASPRLAPAAQSTVDRGELRPTRAGRSTASGPRMETLAATAPAVPRTSKAMAQELELSNPLVMSTGAVSRRRSEPNNLPKQYHTPSPHAGAAEAAAPRAAPATHSPYVEAGFGLRRDIAGGGGAEDGHTRTPREGSSLAYMLGGSGNRSGRVLATGSSARGSQRSTSSRGLSGRERVKGTMSPTVSPKDSPSRKRVL